ncbi:hypothetical protein [Stappia sp. ES.058]|uniref:hypothetical protein n=1 Tax=Stappia sp. ES.058 TaxID=1881061 RepID=UPI0012FD2DD6|nr:hypothetical protein [Stappia sp. ES.058]
MDRPDSGSQDAAARCRSTAQMKSARWFADQAGTEKNFPTALQRSIFFALRTRAGNISLTDRKNAGGQIMTHVRNLNALAVFAAFVFVAAIVVGLI